MTIAHPNDDQEADFGDAHQSVIERPLSADDRVSARWTSALERANKGRGAPLRLPSPIDELPETLKVRTLPAMPWPATWGEMARRCLTLPGDMLAVVGGTGSGKTQWGIQLARGFVASGRGCVLWAPLELTTAQLNLRIVASLAAQHVMDIREWPEQQLTNALATVTDRWRYVDLVRSGPEAQIAAMDIAVEMATQIYGAPPMLVIDYVQKLTRGAQDKRAALSDACETLREMTARRGCYTVALSQTSRANAPLLAGRMDIANATDAVGSGAESSELENASANTLVMNVFKADDAPSLDAHWLLSKLRHVPYEGKIGARYHKAGGVWEELDHLPATPLEVEAEVKKSKRANGSASPHEARTSINASRADAAASKRREAIVAALRRAGGEGMGTRELRKVKGSGSAGRLRETMEELERGGRVRLSMGRWVLVN